MLGTVWPWAQPLVDKVVSLAPGLAAQHSLDRLGHATAAFDELALAVVAQAVQSPDSTHADGVLCRAAIRLVIVCGRQPVLCQAICDHTRYMLDILVGCSHLRSFWRYVDALLRTGQVHGASAVGEAAQQLLRQILIAERMVELQVTSPEVPGQGYPDPWPENLTAAPGSSTRENGEHVVIDRRHNQLEVAAALMNNRHQFSVLLTRVLVTSKHLTHKSDQSTRYLTILS